MSARIDAVDLSNIGQGGRSIDLHAAKRAGLRDVWHKATEGTGFRDQSFPQRRGQVGVVRGLGFGAYHFARPSILRNAEKDGRAQARYFLDYAKPKKGDARCMLDLESTGGLNTHRLTLFVKGWVDEVYKATGTKPIIYTNFDLGDNFDCPLWVARYSNPMWAPHIPRGWKTWTIWQFSDGVYGVPNSVPGIGHCDLNTYNGDPKHLADVLRIGYKAPAPKPTPTPAPKPAPVSLRVVDWNAQRGRDGKVVLKELLGLAAEADVLKLQEVAGYHPQLAQVCLQAGFHIAAAADDVAILVRDGRSIDSACTIKVTKDGWWTVRGHMTGGKSAACAVVEGIGFGTMHTPPTVQTPKDRKNSPRRWKAYEELMASMDIVAAHLGPHAVIAGDWNVAASTDQGMPGWPQHTFKALGMTRFVPKDPTHGNRVIDYGFSKGVTVSGMRTLGKLGSDHRPVSFSVTY